MLLAAIQTRPVDVESIKYAIRDAPLPERRQALDYALRNNSLTMMRILVQGGIDINYPDYAGQTVLCQALSQPKPPLDLVKKMMELGANPNIKDFQNDSALDLALRSKNIPLLAVLLKNPQLTEAQAKIMLGFGKHNDEDYSQKTINEKLMRFIELEGQHEGRPREMFINAGGNCNGWSFLIQYYIALGAEEEFYDILKCISRWDPSKQPDPYDIRLSDSPDITPKLAEKYHTLGKLMRYTVNDLVWFQQKLSLQTATKIEQTQRIEQFDFVKRSDEKVQLKEILNFNAKLNRNEDVAALLDYTRRWPDSWIDISIYPTNDRHQLVGHTISIYITPDGKFKLYDSNRRKRLPEIESLEHIANLITMAIRTESTITGFNQFRFYPSAENVLQPIPPSVPASPSEYATERGRVLLRNAVRAGNVAMTNDVLTHGGSVFLNEQHPDVLNAVIRLALMTQDAELNTRLERLGVNFSKENYADSAQSALRQGKVSLFVKMVERGELKHLINQRNLDDLAPLHVAIAQGDEPLVQDIINLGGDLELKYDNETPLFQAARLGHYNIVQMLLEHRVGIDYQKTGVVGDRLSTALHAAIKEGHAAVGALLLAHGASTTIRNEDGLTAFEVQPLRNEEEIAELIKANRKRKQEPQQRSQPFIMSDISEENNKENTAPTQEPKKVKHRKD